MINKKNKSIRLFAWFGAIVFAIVLASMPFFVNTNNNRVADAMSVTDTKVEYPFHLTYVAGMDSTGATPYLDILRFNVSFSYDSNVNRVFTNVYLKYGGATSFWVRGGTNSLDNMFYGYIPINNSPFTNVIDRTSYVNHFETYNDTINGLVCEPLNFYDVGSSVSQLGSNYGPFYALSLVLDTYVRPVDAFIPIYFYSNSNYYLTYVHLYSSMFTPDFVNGSIVPFDYLDITYNHRVDISANQNGSRYLSFVRYEYGNLTDDNKFYIEIPIDQNNNALFSSYSDCRYYLKSDFALSDSQYYIQGYDDGYDDGLSSGDNVGYQRGYDAGFSVGERSGFNDGVASANDYSFLGLFGAIVDAPLQAFTGLFDFNLSFDGVHNFNLKGFFLAILTISLVIAIIRFAMSR